MREKKEIWVIEDVMTSLSCKLCLLVCENLYHTKGRPNLLKHIKKERKLFVIKTDQS